MKPATQIVHWPGQDTPACDEHLQKLLAVAKIMGFTVTWTKCEETICENCGTESIREIAEMVGAKRQKIQAARQEFIGAVRKVAEKMGEQWRRNEGAELMDALQAFTEAQEEL